MRNFGPALIGPGPDADFGDFELENRELRTWNPSLRACSRQPCLLSCSEFCRSAMLLYLPLGRGVQPCRLGTAEKSRGVWHCRQAWWRGRWGMGVVLCQLLSRCQDRARCCQNQASLCDPCTDQHWNLGKSMVTIFVLAKEACDLNYLRISSMKLQFKSC